MPININSFIISNCICICEMISTKSQITLFTVLNALLTRALLYGIDNLNDYRQSDWSSMVNPEGMMHGNDGFLEFLKWNLQSRKVEGSQAKSWETGNRD